MHDTPAKTRLIETTTRHARQGLAGLSKRPRKKARNLGNNPLQGSHKTHTSAAPVRLDVPAALF